MLKSTAINFKDLSQRFKEATDNSVEIIVGNGCISNEVLESEILDVLNEFNILQTDFNLPTKIKNQFCLYNKLWVRWHKPGTSIMGWFHFPHLFEMIESKIILNGESLYLFDNFQDMWKVYIRLGKIDTEAKLYFFNLYEGTNFQMRINIETYYNKLSLCMGLSDWQEFFMEDAEYESCNGVKKQFKENFEITFPNVPFSDFLKL